MSNSLVITALGHDRPGLVAEISKTINELSCNIEDSRMSVLGGEFAILLLVSGNWDKLAKLETTLKNLQDKTSLIINTQRTEERKESKGKIPYSIEVVSIDHPGIVHKLADFFSSRKINICDMVSGCQPAPHTGTPIFTLNMILEITADTHIATLRDDFMDFCEDLNLDAVMEPCKV
ncbi:MAG: glycine cleavage system protein R [Gammaproteobacteria bacterium]|nr:glycine cleavage system protein R [Gammaproteobacteria bacterium]MDH5777067.1 glycine cleavage system protein R [Gammaproteobacteria bacterium]